MAVFVGTIFLAVLSVTAMASGSDEIYLFGKSTANEVAIVKAMGVSVPALPEDGQLTPQSIFTTMETNLAAKFANDLGIQIPASSDDVPLTITAYDTLVDIYSNSTGVFLPFDDMSPNAGEIQFSELLYRQMQHVQRLIQKRIARVIGEDAVSHYQLQDQEDYNKFKTLFSTIIYDDVDLLRGQQINAAEFAMGYLAKIGKIQEAKRLKDYYNAQGEFSKYADEEEKREAGKEGLKYRYTFDKIENRFSDIDVAAIKAKFNTVDTDDDDRISKDEFDNETTGFNAA